MAHDHQSPHICTGDFDTKEMQCSAPTYTYSLNRRIPVHWTFRKPARVNTIRHFCVCCMSLMLPCGALQLPTNAWQTIPGGAEER